MYPTRGELEQAIQILDNECSEVIKVIDQTKKFLYHGKRTQNDFIHYYIPKEYRAPRDTQLWLSEIVDNVMREKFGWASRSEGVFVTGDYSDADAYGHPHLFFPKDGFRFIWSDAVTDMTSKMGSFNIDFNNINNVLSYVGEYAEKEWKEAAWPDPQTGEGNGKWTFWPPANMVDKFGGPLVFFSYDEIENQFGNEFSAALKKHYPNSITSGRDILPDMSKKGLKDLSRRAPTLAVPDKVRDESYWFHWEPKLTRVQEVKIAKLVQARVTKEAEKKVKELISTYHDKSLEKAISFGTEISVKCAGYYLIRDDTNFRYYYLRRKDKKVW